MFGSFCPGSGVRLTTSQALYNEAGLLIVILDKTFFIWQFELFNYSQAMGLSRRPFQLLMTHNHTHIGRAPGTSSGPAQVVH